MLQAMYNGVSAIDAFQTEMQVIGNNIANVNTTGFKQSDVTFADQLSLTLQGAGSGQTSNIGGTNPQQVGLGVKVGSITANDSQGGLNATSAPTDLALQGNGYFMLAGSSGVTDYTRDGHFTLDSNGQLVDATTGQYVLGWTANSAGQVDTTAQISNSSKLSIPVGGLTKAEITANAAFTGNLNALAPAGTTYSRDVTAYDSLGGAQNVVLTFTKAATPTNTWSWSAAPETGSGTTITTPTGTTNEGTLTFDTSGNLTSATGSLQLTSTTAVSPQNIALDFSKVTQTDVANTSTGTPGASDLAPGNVDGASQGTLQSYSIDPSGVITGIFSNGLTQTLGQVAVSNFANTQGLTKVGNNQYEQSANSGSAVVGGANTNGNGAISSGYLEQSNVDLGAQFANMIVAQNSYAANTKVVTTVQAMLQTLIQMDSA